MDRYRIRTLEGGFSWPIQTPISTHGIGSAAIFRWQDGHPPLSLGLFSARTNFHPDTVVARGVPSQVQGDRCRRDFFTTL